MFMFLFACDNAVRKRVYCQ